MGECHLSDSAGWASAGYIGDMDGFCDIHAHLADLRVRERLDGLLREAAATGVRRILANAAHVAEWPFLMALAGPATPERPEIRAALGLHPFFLETEWTADVPGRLRAALLAAPGACRAVGEIGLDFWPDSPPRDLQIEAFTAQLAVAVELKLPVILHNRKSWNEFLPIWKQLGAGCIPGVCHLFNGSPELAQRLLDAGLFLSFGGPLTWPEAHRVREAATYAPWDRILTETDSPDLAPAPHRGGECAPAHVRLVLDELARVKKIAPEEASRHVWANHQSLTGNPAWPG